MGDMGETFNILKERRQMRREFNKQEYEEPLLAAGAKCLTDGVYRLGDFDCYPARGYARNYKNNRRTCIEFVIKYKGDSSKFPAPKPKYTIRRV